MSIQPLRALVLFTAIILSGMPAATSYASPPLILHDITAGPAPTPSFVAQHKTYLETLPFDGMSLSLWDRTFTFNASSYILSTKTVSIDKLREILAPMSTFRSTKLRQNYAQVFSIASVPDFYDDAGWSIIINNFRNLARVASESGLVGIVFDNEEYSHPRLWGCYGAGNAYCQCNSALASTRSLAQYQSKARSRGRQIMQAMVSEFPAIQVLQFHGPYVSIANLDWQLFPISGAAIAQCNNLRGPFFVGFVEGKAPGSSLIDGGELYSLRESPQFSASFDWRKYTIAMPSTDVTFIPSQTKASWPTKVNVGFGLYAHPRNSAESSPDLFRTKLVPNALRNADGVVWVYTEGFTLLDPTNPRFAGNAWVDAIRTGKAAAQ